VSVTGEPLQLGLEALCEALGDAAFLLLALRGVAVEFDLRRYASAALQCVGWSKIRRLE
jgi:hypothetical protein